MIRPSPFRQHFGDVVTFIELLHGCSVISLSCKQYIICVANENVKNSWLVACCLSVAVLTLAEGLKFLKNPQIILFYATKMICRQSLFMLKPLTRSIVCVPRHKPPDPKDFETLKEFLTRHQRILVLTGAGISTESGE